MTSYVKPSVFWALLSFACLAFICTLVAGPFWAPYLLGIVIVASLVEWGIQRQWWRQVRVWASEMELRWIDNELESLFWEAAEHIQHGRLEAAAEIGALRREVIQERARLHTCIVDARYRINHAVEGVDYPNL